jgi:hypothetical protein
MTSSSQPASRPSRRAVRPAGTVGTDDSVLVSSHPAVPVSDVPEATRADVAEPVAVRESAIPVRSADDSDVGWGEASDANDDRLRQDKPPHW